MIGVTEVLSSELLSFQKKPRAGENSLN